MNRLGLLHPDTMTGRANTERRAVFRAFSNHIDTYYSTAFLAKQPMTGCLVGVGGAIIHIPEFARAFLRFEAAMYNQSEIMDARWIPKLAALVVAAHEESSYAIYASSRTAIASDDLNQAQVHDILLKRRPAGLRHEQVVAFDLASDICSRTGPLSQPSWQAAVEELGLEKAQLLVHCVGLHRYSSTLLNAFDAQLPVSDSQ